MLVFLCLEIFRDLITTSLEVMKKEHIIEKTNYGMDEILKLHDPLSFAFWSYKLIGSISQLDQLSFEFLYKKK